MGRFKASFKAAVLATVASLGIATPPASSAPQHQYDWSGIYFGGHAGGGWANATALDVLPPFGGAFTANGPAAGEGFTVDPFGFVGGAQGGLQRQWGDWVLGGEVSYSYSGINRTITSPLFPASDTAGVRVDNIFMAVARLGYADDNWLLYAKGGFARADVKLNLDDPSNDVHYAQEAKHNGWTVGGGLEYAPFRNVVLGIDYSYIDLGSQTGSGSTDFGPEKFQVDAVVHSVTARLSFKFGEQEPQQLSRRR